MTGPERLELSTAMSFVRDSLERIEAKMDGLDTRVQKIEIASAQQMGVAAGTAAAVASNETRAEKRSMGTARAVGIAASIATIIGVAIGIAIQAFHI